MDNKHLTPDEMLQRLTGTTMPADNSITKRGKVFGGVGHTKKQLKQLNRMRAYVKAGVIGLNPPGISAKDLKILTEIMNKIGKEQI